MKIALIIFFAIFYAVPAHAQNAPSEFGKVSTDDFKIPLAKDSGAAAIMLVNRIETIVEPNTGTRINHHVRVLLLDNAGIRDWSSVIVYAPKIKLSKVKGTTYNLENGAIVKNEIGEDAKFRNRRNKYLDEVKFTFPNVKEGSIVEYSYTSKSEGGFHMYWPFQREIPVIWSEYSLFYPYRRSYLFSDGIKFHVIGDHKIHAHETKLDGYQNKWVMTNLPAFNAEPLMPPENLYRAGIVFGPKGIDMDSIFSENGVFTYEKKYPSAKAKISATADMFLKDDGTLSGKLTLTQDGPVATTTRELYQRSLAAEYRSRFLPADAVVTASEVLNIADTTKPVVEHYEIELSNLAMVNNDRLYINPFVALKEDENPFKSEKRKYPIDFETRLENIFICTIRIPDGYSVEELPKSDIVRLPGDDAKCTLNLTVLGDKIMLSSKTEINKAVYTPEEYLGLREFYIRVMSKKNAFIVLKKDE